MNETPAVPGLPPIDGYSMPIPAERPTARVSWAVDVRRAVLLLHDFQSYFLSPFPENTEPVVPLLRNAKRLLSAFRTAGAPVAYTAQPGRMSQTRRGLLRDFWGPGMSLDARDRAIVPCLVPRGEDWRVTKWRYSAFFESDLLSRMRMAGRDQLVIAGIYSHVGIQTTAVEAYSNDLQTFVVADAVADFTRELHMQTLSYVASVCACVPTTDEVVLSMEN